jgi:hypothetical protein
MSKKIEKLLAKMEENRRNRNDVVVDILIPKLRYEIQQFKYRKWETVVVEQK